jgi:protein-L-isoaspartate O-methyltransferase
MAEYASHPVFARIYARVAEMSERRGGAAHRRKLLAGLRGRVVEVGAGSGANFQHYPTSVSEVIAVEPECYLRERAESAAARSPVSVSVIHGDSIVFPARRRPSMPGSSRSCSAPYPTSSARSRSSTA